MKEYFCKKEYRFLYLSKFFYAFANTLIEVFGTVMLYKNGMPLYMILLIYGIRFGIMGICSPLFLKIASRFGVASCELIANILKIAGTYMIINGEYNNLVIFILVLSLPGALSNPIEDAISSKYVETKHRGKYNSLRNISRILGQAIASVLVTYVVITNNNNLIVYLTAIFFLIDYLCIAFVDYKPVIINKHIFKDTLKYILKSKSNYKKIYALRTNHILERLFIPLYLYIVLQDFVAFSTVITISLLLQIITVLIIGKISDKNIKVANNIVTAIRVVITTIFLFIKNKFAISVNKTIGDNFEKVYETSIQTSIQNIIKKSDDDSALLATVGQMSLCFTEVFVFGALAIISKFIGIEVFKIIFILSIISTIFINYYIKKNKV